MNISSILNKVSEKLHLTQKTEKRSEIQEKGDFFKGSEIDEADIKRADLMGALQNLGGGYQPDPRNGHIDPNDPPRGGSGL